MNGPESLRTFTCVAAELTPPPPARLSRAVTRKFIVRVVVGIDSPIVVVPDSTSGRRGNIREGLVVGRNERKIGREPSSVSGGATVPRSNSSQPKVSASPSESLPVAVNVNGVPIGIVKAGPALTTGGLLPVLDMFAHELPVPPVVKFTICSILLL